MAFVANGHTGEQQATTALVAARRAAGLTQEDLATRSGLSVRAISDIERGLTARPHRRSLEAIAAALDLHGDNRSRLINLYRPAATGSPEQAVLAASGVPQQLPPDISAFAGRATQLSILDTLLTQSTVPPATMVISAIAGTAGVGKTALAIHFAHRVAARFPDGQLYVNLRGFDPTGHMMRPVDALRGFLDAFAVPPQRIPTDMDAQTGLYRSLLAGKRVLVVLDNARDADQVRPLLPGTPGCVAIVTSRNQLSSLVAIDGAHPITLDLLTAADAHALLASRLGAERVATEPHAIDAIIARCARLPLALSIVAARAATRPTFPLTTFADELRSARTNLDALTGDDVKTDARAVFSWSYDTLSGAAARVFRLLALHPGPSISHSAVASLAGLPVAQVRPLLTELTRAHLITEEAPGRYVLHDLLRAYATELIHAHDPETERQAASLRMLDHYLQTAAYADRLLHPYREPIAVAAAQPGVTVSSLTDHRDALNWFTTEHCALLAMIGQAADIGFPTHTWQLAWTLADFLDRRGHWHDAATTQRIAFDATRKAADPVGQAYVHRGLGVANIRLARYDEAHTHLQRALDLTRQLDDHVGQAHIHAYISHVFSGQNNHTDALGHDEQALDLFRAAGHKAGQARALNAIGFGHAHLGNHHQALIYCQQALRLHKEIGNRRGEANAWDSVGYAHHQLGHYQQAIACYQRALDLYRDNAEGPNEAHTLVHIGDTHHATGNTAAARQAWQHAQTILDKLTHPDAEKIRVTLRHFEESTTPGV